MRIFHNQETFPANLFDNGLISMAITVEASSVSSAVFMQFTKFSYIVRAILKVVQACLVTICAIILPVN